MLSVCAASLAGLWGCLSLEKAPQLPAGKTSALGQLRLHSDFPLPAQHRLLDELVELRDRIRGPLDLPITAEPIHVHLFRSAVTFQEYLAEHYPHFPRRRAFFVETDTQLAVYAHWGDRIAEDLRHEVAHAYLHAAVRPIPLWLDEGLAEYFEVPHGRQGRNEPHVRLLMEYLEQRSWHPDLVLLEGIEEPAELAQLHYAEAWAWVHFLLETTTERRRLMQGYLRRLRNEGAAPPLSQVLGSLPDTNAATLVAHLQSLAAAANSPPAALEATLD